MRAPTALLDRSTAVPPGPLALVGPVGAAWLVADGTVDVLMVAFGAAPDGSRRIDQRHHLFTARPGTLLLPGPGGRLGWLAVPRGGATLRAIPAAASAAPSQRTALIAGLERWLAGLVEGIARHMPPRPPLDATVSADAPTAELAAGGRVAGRGDGLWLSLPADDALLMEFGDLGESGQAGPALVPLAGDCWLTALAPLSVTAQPTEAVIDRPELWSGLARFHAALMEVAEQSLRLQAVDEANHLRDRLRRADHGRRAALGALAGALDGTLPAAGPDLPPDDPLSRAVAAIGAHEGFTVRPPPPRRSEAEAPPVPTLDDLAERSGFRHRPVRLDDGWWRHEVGALLAFGRRDGRPLAILPARGGYTLYDPADDSRRPLAPRRDDFAPRAHSFLAPLPERPVHGRDLLAGILARSRGDLAALLATGLVGGGLALALPLAVGPVIDLLVPDGDRPGLLALGALLAVLAIAVFLVGYAGALAYARLEARTGPALHGALLDRLLRLPLGFFRAHTAGDLARRLGAVAALQQTLTGTAARLALTGITALLLFALLLHLDARLASGIGGATLLYGLALAALALARLRRLRPALALDSRVQGLVLQLIAGIAKIRLSGAEDRLFARWAGLQAESLRHQDRAERLAELQPLLFIIYLIAGLMLVFRDIGRADLEAGAGAAVLVGFALFAGAVLRLADTLTGLLALKARYDRARPILEAVPEGLSDRSDPGRLSGRLEVADITFRYTPDGPAVLQNVSLQAAPGEFVALVGPSGCGKSTLLRLMLGFETPEAGSLFFDGQDLSALHLPAVRRQIGSVLQGARLLPGSLLENVLAGAGGAQGEGEAAETLVWQALEQVALAGEVRRLPMGLQTLVTDGLGTLSAGQTQRLLLARALARAPALLLLDEATSALDNRTQAEVMHSLARLSVTRIAVAHRLSTIRDADRIYVLDRGRVVQVGGYAGLMEEEGLFRRLALRQVA